MIIAMRIVLQVTSHKGAPMMKGPPPFILGGYLNMAACAMAGRTSATTKSLLTNTMRTLATAPDKAMRPTKNQVSRRRHHDRKTLKNNFKPQKKGVQYGQSAMNAAVSEETKPKLAAVVNATARP
jgi:hypothetical protein